MKVDRFTSFADLPELLQLEEFRNFLGISRTSAYELVRTGQIPHTRFGRRLFIPRDVLKVPVKQENEEQQRSPT